MFCPGVEQRRKNNGIPVRVIKYAIKDTSEKYRLITSILSGKRFGFGTCGSLSQAQGDRIDLWWIEELSKAAGSRLAKQKIGIDYTEIVWISICTLYDSQLNTLSRTEKYGQSKPAFLYQCATSSVLKNHCCSFSPSKLQKEELLYLLYSDFPVWIQKYLPLCEIPVCVEQACKVLFS